MTKGALEFEIVCSFSEVFKFFNNTKTDKLKKAMLHFLNPLWVPPNNSWDTVIFFYIRYDKAKQCVSEHRTYYNGTLSPKDACQNCIFSKTRVSMSMLWGVNLLLRVGVARRCLGALARQRNTRRCRVAASTTATGQGRITWTVWTMIYHVCHV